MIDRPDPARGGATGLTPIDAPEEVRRYWIWLAILGVFLVFAGMMAVVAPVAAGVAATLVIGAALLVGGAIKGWHAFRCAGWRARLWHGVSALIYILGGLLMLFQPLAGVIALSLLIIAILIADGLARVVVGLRMRPERGWGWMTAGGVLSAALGLALAVFALPEASLTLLGAVVGVSLIFEGAAYVYIAFAARPRSDRTVSPDAT